MIELDHFEIFLVALFARHRPTAPLEELCEEVHIATKQLLEKSDVTNVHIAQMKILSEIIVPTVGCTAMLFLEIAHCAAKSLDWDRLTSNLKAELAFDGLPASKDLH